MDLYKKTIVQDSNPEQKKKIGRWTEEEDNKLQQLIEEYGEKSWRIISDLMEGRSAIQCLHRWTKILKPGLRKGPWQEEEDEKLLEWVKTNGSCKWSLCAENIQGRSGKQCRERWFNNLNPNVKKGGWTPDEDEQIFRGYLQFSSSWSKIAKNLLGRTENSVKNRFYSTVRKLLADQEKEGGNAAVKALQAGSNSAALHSFVKEQLNKISKNRAQNIHPQQCELSQKGMIEEEEEEDNDIDGDEAELDEVYQEEQQSENKLEEKNDEKFNLEKQEIEDSSNNDENIHEDDSKSKKKGGEAYPEQNLLYRLLKQQGGPIKRTLCMKDYSTIYKKYKKRYNQKKRDKKLSEKVEILRKLIQNREDDQNDFNYNPKKAELLQKKAQKTDIEKKINQVESQLAHLQSEQQKQLIKHQFNKQSTSPEPEIVQTALINEQMMEIQHRLMEFFNHSLSEDIGSKQEKSQQQPQSWQMIFAPTDARIVYPPANMPPDIKICGLPPNQNQASYIQVPNIVITPKRQMTHMNNQQISQNQIEEPKDNNKHQRKSKRRGNSKKQNKKIKIEQQIDQNQQNSAQNYENVVGDFFKRFSHLGIMGITQLGQSVQENMNRQDKNFQSQVNSENKVDQKMMFLISQLHTLESMLSKTKSELSRLEASIHDKMNSELFEQSQQNDPNLKEEA